MYFHSTLTYTDLHSPKCLVANPRKCAWMNNLMWVGGATVLLEFFQSKKLKSPFLINIQLVRLPGLIALLVYIANCGGEIGIAPLHPPHCVILSHVYIAVMVGQLPALIQTWNISITDCHVDWCWYSDIRSPQKMNPTYLWVHPGLQSGATSRSEFSHFLLNISSSTCGIGTKYFTVIAGFHMMYPKFVPALWHLCFWVECVYSSWVDWHKHWFSPQDGFGKW